MADTYQLFRLSLIERSDNTLFVNLTTTRSEYLRQVFSQSFSFLHYKNNFYYRPATEVNGCMLGRVGREIQAVENLSPEEGFDEQLHDAWLASVLLVQPDDDGNGQKLALQLQKQVGSPYAILRSLIAQLNDENLDSRFVLEAQPIFDAATFWKFAEAHKGSVVSLTFDLIVTNGLWSASSTFRDELKQANAQTNVQELTTTLKSRSGLKTDSQAIAEAVEYAEKGSGTIAARSADNHKYNSKNKIKSVSLLEDLGRVTRSHLAKAAASVARILENE